MADKNEQAKAGEDALKDIQQAQEQALKDRAEAVDQAVKNQQADTQSFVEIEEARRKEALEALEDEDAGADGQAKVDSTGVKTNPEATAAEDPRNTPEGQVARKGNAAQAKRAEKERESSDDDKR